MSRPLQRAVTDFAADVSFAQAVDKVVEHDGVLLSESSIRRVSVTKKKRMKLIFKQIDQRQSLEQRGQRLENFKQAQEPKMNRDIAQYREIMQQKREVFERAQTPDRSGRKQVQTQGPSLERER